MTDHYEALGVARGASADDIKRAFRAQCKAHHPDRDGGNHERMAAINLANDVLSDPDRRARYDATGDGSAKPSLQDQAVSVLVAVFSRMLAEDGNLIEAVRADLSDTRKAGNAKLKTMKRQSDKIKARRDRVRVKSGENIVHQLIDAQVASLAQNIASVQNAIGVMAEALKMLNEYECDEEVGSPKDSMDAMISAMFKSARGGPSFKEFGGFKFSTGGF